MSDLFKINDPRGKIVTCSNECWEKHILKSRPWMRSYEKRVKQTIKKPAIITQDANFEDRQCYYRLGQKNYIKAIVVFDSSGRGVVITAFVSDSSKNGEVQIWAK